MRNNTIKHCVILGTRPEIIKLSPILRYLGKTSRNYILIHSNQHYSPQMDTIFFKELEIPKPTYNLQVGSGLQGEQTARILEKTEKILLREKPDVVYVQGDTNTVLAGALSAAKIGLRVAHVEAGLRSYDRAMPEELNRIMTDHISDYLFPPTKQSSQVLLSENINKNSIFVVGNTIVDAVFENLKIANRTIDVFKQFKIAPNAYFLLTMHRPSNVDNKLTLLSIINAFARLEKLSKQEVIFPVHPRTKKQLELFRITLPNNIRMVEPVGFMEMLQLENNAAMIFTDSGGVQEEACILKKKCLTLRENTERPETVDVGGNILVGSNTKTILSNFISLQDKKVNWKNPFGEGNAGKKIVTIVEQCISGDRSST